MMFDKYQCKNQQTMNSIDFVNQELAPLRSQLCNHRVYQLLNDIEDIRIFMKSHVYAVWDFMSLLKSLQINLTSMSLPWKPKDNSNIVRFINEIVQCEESDIDNDGQYKSHFEMYLDAMYDIEADTSGIIKLLNIFDQASEHREIIEGLDLPSSIKSFLSFTFSTIATNKNHKIAAAFTYGREDLIPDMFFEIINKSSPTEFNRLNKLNYYLRRHIEIDGEEHGPLSIKMIESLCGNDERKWSEVLEVAKEALIQRIYLWDDIAEKIENRPKYSKYRELSLA